MSSEWNASAVRALRREFGMQQYELAEALGVSHSRISEIESGKRQVWSVLARCLDYYSELERIRRRSPMVVDEPSYR